jgi:hypothetical protein
VQKVLGANYSLASISSWADDVRDARPKTYNWHLVDIPLAVDTYDPGRECKPDPLRGGGTARFRIYELVSVCGIWQWGRHSCLLSPRAFFRVSFLMCS